MSVVSMSVWFLCQWFSMSVSFVRLQLSCLLFICLSLPYLFSLWSPSALGLFFNCLHSSCLPFSRQHYSRRNFCIRIFGVCNMLSPIHVSILCRVIRTFDICVIGVCISHFSRSLSVFFASASPPVRILHIVILSGCIKVLPHVAMKRNKIVHRSTRNYFVHR